MTKKINTTLRKTKRLHKSKIQGKIIATDRSGWKSVHIWGEPFERGFAHGYLLYRELRRVRKSLVFLVNEQIQVSFHEYMSANKKIMIPILKTKYPEFYEEIRGIHFGAKKAGTNISLEILIAWNSFLSLYSYFREGKEQIQRCSAFIATGNATKNGDIIMAHNTHTDLLTGQLLNIILKITPKNGYEFLMQTSPGMICSAADWYISKSGIVCCETTIAEIKYGPKFGFPFFCRIRDTIQYANSLDQCIQKMTTQNAGDYACSWLFGHIETGEIMLLELGLHTKNIQRTKNGVFYGMNSAMGLQLRTQETTDTDFNDISGVSGNRNYRLNYLLNEQYYGKIDKRVAKKVMGDHYDVELGRNIMNMNVVCKHPELDPNTLFRPYSCTDGKILDSNMAKKMEFEGLFGSGCGKRFFDKSKYIQEHPEFKPWGELLEDMPIQKWTILP